MPNKDQLKTFCYNPDGSLRSKAESRAGMINHLILEELEDIDEAENFIDKCLREWNLWGEPTLEEILYGDDEIKKDEPLP